MSQLTLYLDKATESRLRTIARESGQSLSKWVALILKEKVASEWSPQVRASAGSWKDFPSAESLRSELGTDAPREGL